jgi:hypothetical protein
MRWAVSGSPGRRIPVLALRILRQRASFGKKRPPRLERDRGFRGLPIAHAGLRRNLKGPWAARAGGLFGAPLDFGADGGHRCRAVALRRWGCNPLTRLGASARPISRVASRQQTCASSSGRSIGRLQPLVYRSRCEAQGTSQRACTRWSAPRSGRAPAPFSPHPVAIGAPLALVHGRAAVVPGSVGRTSVAGRTRRRSPA